MELHEITQGMLEAYEEQLVGAEVKTEAQARRLVVEAARRAGIATGLPDNLALQPPRDVSAWATAILDHVAKAKAPLSGE